MQRYSIQIKPHEILLVCSLLAVAGSAPDRAREEIVAGCLELKPSKESHHQLTEASRTLLQRNNDLVLFAAKNNHPSNKETLYESNGDDIELCKGRVESEKSEEDVYVVTESAQPSKVVYLLVPMTTAREWETVTLRVECHNPMEPKCFLLLPTREFHHHHVRRREAQQGAHHSGPSDSEEGTTPTGGVGGRIVWLCIGGLGLLGLLATLAMCARGSKGYEPDFPDSRGSDEVATPSESGTTTVASAAPKSESMTNLLDDESYFAGHPPSSEGKSATISMASNEGSRLKELSDSQDPIVQPGNEPEVRSKDAPPSRPLTAEDLANSVSQEEEEVKKKPEAQEGENVEEEGEAAYASVKKPDGEYDYVDKKNVEARNAVDEAGYAYATVGGAMGGVAGGATGEGPARQAAGGNNQDERGGEEKKEKGGGGLPPYGKVTRHMVPMSKKSGYSEVLTSSPMLGGGRTRAITDPVDPERVQSPKRQVGQGREGMRDERAFTESAAHLPLPQIPRLDVTDETYDSIPDELKEGRGGGVAEGSEGKANPRNIRESVYESVEVDPEPKLAPAEGEEDMYESVPEDMKQAAQTPSSPDTLSPTSPFPPPAQFPPPAPRSPTPRTKVPAGNTTPPASPLVKEHTKEQVSKKDSKSEAKKHKMLSKTKSHDTVSDSRGRSLSSIFSRKKGGSNAPAPAPSTPKQKKQHEPLPKVPTEGAIPSPTHLLPPSPSIPAPSPPQDVEDDEDEPADSAYDTVEVINPKRAAAISAAKAKSASLPSSMRASGASMLHTVDHGPLPDVPEESSGGLVTRKRVQEDMDPAYDTVVLGQVQSDPSYDSVEVSAARGGEAVHKLEPAEPSNQQPVDDAAAPSLEEGLGTEGGQIPANKYARVSSHAAAESSLSPPEHSAISPEHDELGYAVIPAHLKIRKRALSDAALKRSEAAGRRARAKSVDMDDDESNKAAPISTTTKGEVAKTEEERPSTPPMEPEYESVTDAMKEAEELVSKKENPYAKVDMAAKRKSQLLKQQLGTDSMIDPDASQIPRDPSPNPPPLPHQGDLGDLTEYQQPPVPVQAEGALELLDTESKTIKPYSEIDLLIDPPYASVKKKDEVKEESNNEANSDPPYASVKNKSVEDDSSKAKDKDAASTDPPYASVKDKREGSAVESERASSDPPYASVPSDKPPTEELKSALEYEEENPYSTVSDNAGRMESPSGPSDPPYAKIKKGKVVENDDEGPGYAKAGLKCLAGGATGESATVVESMNGTNKREDDEDDMYDKLDHTLGGAGRINIGLSPPPGEGSEYSTLTVDFSTSPDLVVTCTDSLRREENGVVRQVEETTINFSD